MSGSHFPSQRLFATKAAKDRSLTRAFTSYFKYFLQKCQHMRIAMTGQPASHLAAWPLGEPMQSTIQRSNNPAVQHSAMARSPNQSQKAFKPKGCRHRSCGHGKATRRFHEIFNSFFFIFIISIFRTALAGIHQLLGQCS